MAVPVDQGFQNLRIDAVWIATLVNITPMSIWFMKMSIWYKHVYVYFMKFVFFHAYYRYVSRFIFIYYFINIYAIMVY